MGVCQNRYTCSSRHTLSELDRSRKSFPRIGDIKFKILATHSPSHFTVRLVEHRTLQRIKWQKIRRQVVEIRIAGVVPVDSRTTWTKNAKESVKHWFRQNEKCDIQATIEWTLMYCIWVKSVEIVKKSSSIDKEVLSLDIKKQIVDHCWGVTDRKALETLQKMAQKTGMSSVKLFSVF